MGVIPPRPGRKVFSPTSSKNEAGDFRQELGEFCFVPLLPKAVMTPTHWSHPSSKNQIVVSPQFSWWEEAADQADGREGDSLGMSAECST